MSITGKVALEVLPSLENIFAKCYYKLHIIGDFNFLRNINLFINVSCFLPNTLSLNYIYIILRITVCSGYLIVRGRW